VRTGLTCCLILLYCLACQRSGKRIIIGDWQAALLVEGSDTVASDLSQIRLKFSESDQFVFRKTMIDSISGMYTIENFRLTLLDDNGRDTLLVQILPGAQNEIALRMNHDGKEQILYLRRNE